MSGLQDVLDGLDRCLAKIDEGQDALVRAQDRMDEAGQPNALGVLLASHDPEAQQAVAGIGQAAEVVVRSHQVLNRAEDMIDRYRRSIAGDVSADGGSSPPTTDTRPESPAKIAQGFGTPVWSGVVGEELKHIKPTAGVVFDEEGNRITLKPLRSGEGTNLFRKTDEYLRSVNAFPALSPRAPVPTASHVETQVAVMMRERGLRHATVVINKDRVCEGPYGCWTAVAAILPRGSSVTVWCKGRHVPCELSGGSTS